jgi:hypothetical protein
LTSTLSPFLSLSLSLSLSLTLLGPPPLPTYRPAWRGKKQGALEGPPKRKLEKQKRKKKRENRKKELRLMDGLRASHCCKFALAVYAKLFGTQVKINPGIKPPSSSDAPAPLPRLDLSPKSCALRSLSGCCVLLTAS